MAGADWQWPAGIKEHARLITNPKKTGTVFTLATVKTPPDMVRNTA
jgi:hypothetical protein